jgi:hypothetical protein
MRKADGFYKTTTDANLRSLNHTVLGVLPKGTTVYARNNRVESNFKAGTSFLSPTNEHTWVEWDDPADSETQYAEGWIEDGKLQRAQSILQEHFVQGDKIYGRHETRYSIIRSNATQNRSVRRKRFNIIDDVNDQILGGVTEHSDREVRDFAEFAQEKTGLQARQIRIRKMCKLGLAYCTQANMIHFMLDGLSANEVALEAVNARNVQEAEAEGRTMNVETQKRCTGSELRALMRQRLFDLNRPGGKDEGIDLDLVRFYLLYEETPAPWSNEAAPAWHQAWLAFSAYRAQVGAQKDRIRLAGNRQSI